MSKVQLGDVAREYKEVYKGDRQGMPIVGLEHLISQQFKLDNWDINVDNTFTKVFRKGMVLFGRRRAYLKKACYATVDGICSGDITVIEAIPTKIYPELLPFIVQNDDLFDFAVGKSAGSLSPRVKWEHLKNYQFELPDSMEKQKEMAELLWSMVETKTAYKKAMDAMVDVVNFQFDKLLKDPNAKLHLIKDVFTLQMGKTPAREDSKCWDSKDYKWLSIADLEEGEIYTGNSKEYISEYAVKKSGIKITPKDTVIMSFKLTIGRTLITSEDLYTNEAIMAFIPKRKINTKFLRYFFAHKDWSEKSNRAVKGITLNKDSIGNSTIILPSEDTMKKILDLLDRSEKLQLSIKKSITALDRTLKKIIEDNFKVKEE